ncbi:serine/threonine-protein kinase [Nocardia sp. NPDC004068]|uniref:serine/threonine-protein kinase n=1 Tax=Nocardia sp. NPDC004068 TaxID=3364303 RepID=UPI0036941063
MRLVAGDVFAGYRIVRLVGVGGMGEVYLAEHPRLPRWDAVKILDPGLGGDPEFRLRFLREGELAARLEHPNVVSIYDRGAEGEVLWIAMRYVEGADLAELARGGVSPERAVRIIGQAARGLDAAHRAGLLHRDVKPANILVAAGDDGSDIVRITDFGIARQLDAGTSITASGAIAASLAYAAPEQLSGDPLSPRTDVYALGCTLFEILTGRTPFGRRPVAALVHAHLSEPRPRPSTLAPIPPAMDAVIARAMAKDPAHRFASCGELAAAAAEALTAPRWPRSASAGPDSARLVGPESVRAGSGSVRSAWPELTSAGPDSARFGGPESAQSGSGSVGPDSARFGGPESAQSGSGSVRSARPESGWAGSGSVRPFGAESTSAGPGWRESHSAPRHSTGSLGLRVAVVVGVLVLAGAAVVAGVRFGGGVSGHPVAASTTTTTAAATTTPAESAWGPAAYIVAAFPRLLPPDPEGTGYQGMRCALNDDRGTWLHCPTDEPGHFSVNIHCSPDRRAVTYSADRTGLADLHEERWARPSGTGTVRWASDSLAGFGLLDIAFDDPGRNFCVVGASGGSGGRDVYDNWWAGAPL